VLCGPSKYSKWSVQKKSLGTTALTQGKPWGPCVLLKVLNIQLKSESKRLFCDYWKPIITQYFCKIRNNQKIQKLTKNLLQNLAKIVSQYHTSHLFDIEMQIPITVLSLFFVVKPNCDSRFQCAFTACSWIFKVITLVGSNQRNFFENANACSKRTLKTTQL